MVEFDPYDSAFQHDPYPMYKILRAKAPVHYIEDKGFWILTRWDDAHRVGNDPAMSAALGVSQRDPFPRDATDLPPYAHSIIASDPPEHTRFRRILQKIFGPRAIRSWPPRIQSIADRLVADLVAAGRDGGGDVVRQLAHPLPAAVIVDLMGMPQADMADVARWSDDVVSLLPGAAEVEPAVLQRAMKSSDELIAYCEALLEERRSKPGADNLIDDLLQARDDSGEPLSKQEMLGNIVAVILAGLETTGSLISNGMAALLDNPDELRLLRESPDLVPAAVEEMLRYDGPGQGTFRTTLEDIVVDGVTIREGERVMLGWASANRDEARFPDGDGELFRIKREPISHMGFAVGRHHCLGAQLARMESEAAFGALLRQTTSISLSGDPTMNLAMMPVIRGRATVPVSIT